MEGITIFKGVNPGPVIAIIGSMHGNEVCGARAIETLKKQLTEKFEETPLLNGEIRLIVGNPKALSLNQRFVDKDLNRNFIENPDPNHYETARAQEIMTALEGAHSIVDIHSMTSKGASFAIYPTKNEHYHGFHIYLPVEYASDGWDGLLEGALMSWALEKDMDYVAVECGQNHSEEADALAYQIACSFIEQSFSIKIVEDEFRYSQKHLQLITHIPLNLDADHKEFHYENEIHAFSEVKPEQIIAKDESGQYSIPDLKTLENELGTPIKESDKLVIFMIGSEESIKSGINKEIAFVGVVSDLK